MGRVVEVLLPLAWVVYTVWITVSRRIKRQKERLEDLMAGLALQATISGYGSVDAYIKAMLAEKGVNPYQPQIVPQQVQGH
jgi:hypothetical protein